MQRFEINDATGVLVDIPTGKMLLGGGHRTQSPQKTGTCWYYTLNPLRIRFHGVETIVADEVAPQLPELLGARRKEKIISTYRKALTKLNQQRELDKSLIMTEFKNASLTADEAKLELAVLNQKKEVSSNKVQLLQAFVESKAVDVKVFIRERDFLARQSAVRKMLVELKLDPDKELNVQLSHCYPTKKIADLSSLELTTLYFQTAKNVAIREYCLERTSWDPSQGMIGLMSVIRKYGMLATFGFNGVPYYKGDSRRVKMPGTRHQVFHLDEKQFDAAVSARGSHAVNIVGAVKVEDQNYVVIRDPKQGSPVTTNHKGTVYVVDYDHFCSNLHNMHGKSYLNQRAKPPYALGGTKQLAQFESMRFMISRVGLFKIKHAPDEAKKAVVPAVIKGYLPKKVGANSG